MSHTMCLTPPIDGCYKMALHLEPPIIYIFMVVDGYYIILNLDSSTSADDTTIME